jgi:hypothetical protein
MVSGERRPTMLGTFETLFVITTVYATLFLAHRAS